MGYWNQYGEWEDEDDIFEGLEGDVWGEDFTDGQINSNRQAAPVGQAQAPQYGTYMGKQVTPASDPQFADRQQSLMGNNRELLDAMRQRAMATSDDSLRAISLANMMASTGGVATGKLPDAQPYVNAYNRRADALDQADTNEFNMNTTQEERLAKHIDDAYTDQVNAEKTEYDRKTSRYERVEGMMTKDRLPVYRDKETNQIVDSRGKELGPDDIATKMDRVDGEDGSHWFVDPYTGKAIPMHGNRNPGATGPSAAPGGNGAAPGSTLSAIVNNETPNGSDYDANGNMWRSPKGAMGKMQVMPATARDPGYGIRPWDGKSMQDLERVGVEYEAMLQKKYNGDPRKVLAAYNAGPGRVDQLIARYGDDWQDYLPGETKGYLAKGLTHMGSASYTPNGDEDAVGGGDMDGEAGQYNGYDIINTGPKGSRRSGGSTAGQYQIVKTDTGYARIDKTTGNAEPIGGIKAPAGKQAGASGGGKGGLTGAQRAALEDKMRTARQLRRQVGQMRAIDEKDQGGALNDGIIGGRISGDLPWFLGGDEETSQWDSYRASVAPMVKKLTRTPGEGADNKGDDSRFDAILPQRTQRYEGRQTKYNELQKLADSTEITAARQLGLKPVGRDRRTGNIVYQDANGNRVTFED